MKNAFPPVRVMGKMKGADDYRTNDTLQLIDVVTGKMVLEVGTDNSDDYYHVVCGSLQSRKHGNECGQIVTRPANDNAPFGHNPGREIAMVAIDFYRDSAVAIRRDGRRFDDLLIECMLSQGR